MKNNKIVEIFSKHTPNTPLSIEESEFLIKILLSNDDAFKHDLDNIDKESEVYKHFKPLFESHQVRVFLKRLEMFTTLKISVGVLIMLSMYMNNLGIAVLLVYYLHYKLPDNTFIDTDVYTMKLFPFGVFSEEQYKQIWEEQKVKKSDDLTKYKCIGAPDNLIDYYEFWIK